ncbi:MAG TPA: hypothetical protein VNM37_08100 [Candidatus Dormibacteraeota bacterium]|nr:hypothetical protein [Candidatus Dormibacteraeota bacterium]
MSVDANVALVQADIATLKTNVQAVQAKVNDLLAKQAAAIDAEDLAAIKAAHDDLAAANAGLSFTAGQATPTVIPAPASAA